MTKDKKRPSGTYEWAHKTYNICNGCEHGCRFCFAHYNAVMRFKTMTSEQWKNPTVNKKAVGKKWGLLKGKTIMFPSTHDITPAILDDCITTLNNMLSPGNKVLIVSKPHLECVEKMCEKLISYKSQILFRFTIGALDDAILRYWEPNAPNAAERMASLRYAHENGFSTSISMEPNLDWTNVIDNFYKMDPYVSDSIWIGAMNVIDRRVAIETDEDQKQVDRIKGQQTLQNMTDVYASLKNHPLVRWKESIKQALNLDIPNEIGLDI